MPDLSSRVRPPQILLAVGAVLLLAGAVGGSAPGARAGLLAGAVAAGVLSARAAGSGLLGTREALAATAVVLAAVAVDDGGPLLDGSATDATMLALVLAGVARLQPGPLSWPLGAWAVGQLAALRAVANLAAGVPRTCAVLAVALAGLVVVLGARRVLARIALLTTAPWWIAGVAAGIGAAWTDVGSAAMAAAGLTVAAAAGLLVARLEPHIGPLLGPPRAAPVLAGLVSGGALAGALSAGPGAEVVAGYAGVLLAAAAAAVLDGWRRGLLLPAALAAGTTLLACALVQLTGTAAWRELAVLLLLTALPAVAVAHRRHEDRPAAVPTAVGCLAAAVLLAVPAGLLAAPPAAGLLTALYVAALAVGARLAPGTRRPAVAAGAAAAAAALALLVAAGTGGQLAAALAVQGAATWGWAVVLGQRDAGEAAPARVVGVIMLVLAAWTAAAAAGGAALEAYTLPAAAGLLLAAGPELTRGASWPAWGPGLLVAAVPSVLLSVVQPGVGRPLLVLVLAAAAMVGGSAAGVRTPLLVGAGAAVALAAGLAVTSLPLPLAGALLAGVALLVLGARRELRPVGGFAARLADMR
ncbi:SCO7613 C-terminal domain-containing membrane protein [Trujillonella endophytica]|uniref:SCO7613 C-terminal domain-containing membrane protein n=1 Tax=Trujillonella endophytica TaxID=673521 RepID=UPI000B852140|nr:hypothetical protein [Trujillella endophytica]